MYLWWTDQHLVHMYAYLLHTIAHILCVCVCVCVWCSSECGVSEREETKIGE